MKDRKQRNIIIGVLLIVIPLIVFYAVPFLGSGFFSMTLGQAAQICSWLPIGYGCALLQFGQYAVWGCAIIGGVIVFREYTKD